MTERSSGSFPRVGEDDLYSFPEPDLHLDLKTKPKIFAFEKQQLLIIHGPR